MLRERLSGALKGAIDNGDDRAAGTLRLVLAALKERDHCARQAAATGGISDAEIVAMLRDMVEQRRCDIPRCEETARVDQARAGGRGDRHPRALPAAAAERRADRLGGRRTIRELGATKLKDTGRVIAALKQRYNGQMDFGTAKRLLCERLH